MVSMPDADELQALKQALAQALADKQALEAEKHELQGLNRVLRTERDLLQEQLKRFLRKWPISRLVDQRTDDASCYSDREATVAKLECGGTSAISGASASAGIQRCCGPRPILR